MAHVMAAEQLTGAITKARHANPSAPFQDRSQTESHGPVETWTARAVICLASCLALTSAVPQMSSGQMELMVLYYQPLLPQLAMLSLWATAVSIWHRRHIDYTDCFPLHQHQYLLDHMQLAGLCLSLLTTVLCSAAAFSVSLSMGWTRVAALQPQGLYMAILALLTLPLGGVLHSKVRIYFRQNVRKLMLPLQPVGWAEFLLADVLTSLSKPLSDTERAICHMVTGPVLSPLTSASGGRENVCSNASPIIPLVLAAPYAWRLAQCLRAYSDTKELANLGNALKYTTAFPVIVLSHLRYHVSEDQWEATIMPAWVCASAFNTAFSVYWDTERDWGIPWLVAGHLVPRPAAKPRKLYGSSLLYSWAVVSNVALRVAWTYKLSPHLRHYRLVGLLVCLMEVLRRFQWVFFRVETELWKLSSRMHHSKSNGALVS